MGSLSIDNMKKMLTGDNLVIFEIGSNVGRDTKRFVEAFPKSMIYCFEPDGRCIIEFNKVVSSKKVVLTKAAVSNYNGYLDFNLSSGHRPKSKRRGGNHSSVHINSSSIKNPTGHKKKHPWCKYDETVSVETVSLDKWCGDNSISKIDFIWADVQGAEKDFILGAINILKKTKYLYTEYSDNELFENQINGDSILKMLPRFTLEKDYKNNMLLKNKDLI